MTQTDLIIKKKLEESKTIAIFGHYHPDGDCVGSLLGLGKALENLGKKVDYFTPSPPSKVFSFLPSFSKIKTNFTYKKYDTIIFVDLGSYTRIGKFWEENPEYFTQQTVIIFDHHPEQGPENALMIKDIQASSTAELLFEYIQKRWKGAIDQEVATAFYLGLVTDSGNFMFDQNHERIFTNALNLIKF
jgi:phosphoesterase RecJ-like protein